MTERAPTKRKVKPAQNLLSLEDLGESSDDSDFRIEDHCEESDDSLDSDGEEKGGGNDDDDNDDDDDDSDDDYEDGDDDDIDADNENNVANSGNAKLTNVLATADERRQLSSISNDAIKIMICCVCLGDRSDATNEIVECDGCGVTVHEGCYGVSENDSFSSSVSSCSTMPWFCEACRAGVDNPECELCPNTGGIYKETDVGKWVHLVCALYIPGVAFGEVDKLGSVTLFEMAYSKWGSKACQLCADKRLARTGVAVGCDAGMCRTYFHVTCGQAHGLLAEAHSEEVEQADPFYAHCKLHSEKTLVRKRRRNWLALQLRTEKRKEEYAQEGHSDLPQQLRIQRKLEKYRGKYSTFKITKPTPWVPTQKMGRLLTTSASACRALWRKAELSGIDVEAWEIKEAQVAALADVQRKWYIPPAFSFEFIGYYLDRNSRVGSMRRQLAELLDENSKLSDEQKVLQEEYDVMLKENTKEIALTQSLKNTIKKYHSVILKVAPNKKLPNVDLLGKQVVQTNTAYENHHPLATPHGVPTPAALKAGVGFPLRTSGSGSMNIGRGVQKHGRSDVPLNNECGICRRNNDQHLLAKCDTCHLYYHLGCLHPPLTRMPKKNKIMGWQCSECDKDSSGSDVECVDTEAPRRLRHVKDNNSNGESLIKEEDRDDEHIPTPVLRGYMLYTDPLSTAPVATSSRSDDSTRVSAGVDGGSGGEVSGVMGRKKRRREKHHRYSPSGVDAQHDESGGSRPHKRKRKRKSVDSVSADSVSSPPELSTEQRQSLKICFKSIPHHTGEGSVYVATTPGTGSVRPTYPTVAPSHPIIAPLAQPAAASRTMQRQQMAAVAASKKKSDVATVCSTCSQPGSTANLVVCDECLKGFHFHCLDPPVKKSPKVRGYSWHCADCDPTESDSS